MNCQTPESLILVTGATGYVGARLIPLLLREGYRVRAVARSMDKLRDRSWSEDPNVELLSVDLLDGRNLAKAAKGCKAAYYLVHSMGSTHNDFAKADRLAATNMVSAAQEAKLERIIYLGGLGKQEDDLSDHLRSRAEVAEILLAGSVPVTVLRAAMIIGAGSASFEILRYLTERLPVMITPRWVQTPSQPIAIRDVLYYLVACLKEEKTKGQIYDIGGPNVLSYKELMEIYAQEAELPKRIIIPVPVFTPKLSSYWIHLVTPVPAYIAQPLAEGLRNPAICDNNKINSILPHDSLSCRQAIKLALERIKDQKVESHWSDAGQITSCEWSMQGDPSWVGGTLFRSSHKLLVNVPSNNLWNTLTRTAGNRSWCYKDWLWRVAMIKPNESLSLVAEMKLPGKALLEFRIRKVSANKTEITQTTQFIPKGLFGILYWWALYPLHVLTFRNMLRGLVEGSKIN